MKKAILLFVLGFAIIAASSHADDGWERLDRDETQGSGWVLDRRDKPPSSFPEFRIVGLIDAPPVVAAKAAREQLANAKYAVAGEKRRLIEESDGRLVVYSVFDFPVLFDDRDVATRIDFHEDPASGVYGLTWKAAPDKGPAEQEGVVRMPASSGSWEFAPAEGGRTQSTLVMHTDLGGAIPAWLVNGRSADFCLQILQSSRRIAARLK